jgi:C_GCAxxG_C_C family probable redox protein
VQRQAEEYNYVLMNCAQSTALAVMEEFGFGSMEVLKALSPLPGCGGTGWTCGAVSGGLASIGLYAGGDSLPNVENAGRVMMLAQNFMNRFEEELGAVLCPHIQENAIFGRYMDPGASPENMQLFTEAKGFEKCSLVPGIGARIVAEIILEQIAES